MKTIVNATVTVNENHEVHTSKLIVTNTCRNFRMGIPKWVEKAKGCESLRG